MWDEEDGFFYDVLRLPDGSGQRLKVRSMVGLLPLCATTVIEAATRERIPGALAQIAERLRRMPELLESIHPTGEGHLGVADRRHLALVNPERLRRILGEDARRGGVPQPLRHPLALPVPRASTRTSSQVEGREHRVDYLPAESDTGMFGGNSNWRGPVWMPVNVLIIRALLQYYLYYGDDFRVECPTGSGQLMNLFEVAEEIAERLGRHLPARPGPGGGRCTAAPGSSRRTRTGATTCSSTSTSTATTGPGSAPATRPAGPAWWPRPSSSTACVDAKRFLEQGKQAGFVKGQRPA